jgi:RNA polymerase-interacting CarD/CdnL/TRCF family regulator
MNAEEQAAFAPFEGKKYRFHYPLGGVVEVERVRTLDREEGQVLYAVIRFESGAEAIIPVHRFALFCSELSE